MTLQRLIEQYLDLAAATADAREAVIIALLPEVRHKREQYKTFRDIEASLLLQHVPQDIIEELLGYVDRRSLIELEGFRRLVMMNALIHQEERETSPTNFAYELEGAICP